MTFDLEEKEKAFPKYIRGFGIFYKNEFKMIGKAKNVPFQPVYEAFMNAWESFEETCRSNHHITISIYVKKDLLSNETEVYDFEKIVVEDDGIGINDENYQRLLTLRDDGKKNKNKGTGRVQYLHFFEETQIESVYTSENGAHQYRRLTLSKDNEFIQNNSFVRLDEEKIADTHQNYTKVTFNRPYDQNDEKYYASTKPSQLKNYIIRNFISLLCDNEQNLPSIEIRQYTDNHVTAKKQIQESDIVKPQKTMLFNAHYEQINQRGKLEILQEKEEFNIRTFVLPQTILGTNRMVLSSKGSEGKTIQMQCMSSTTPFGGKRFLFLISGDYIENSETDQRGEFKLLTKKEMESRGYSLLKDEKYITIDNIRQSAENEVIKYYPEIKKIEESKEKRISELAHLFLIDQQRIDKVKNNISCDDSDEDILRKIYTDESRDIATSDANLKAKLDNLGSLDPSDDSYRKDLQELTDDITNDIPDAQKNELSKYVVRRKLVLDLLDLILQKQAECSPDGKKVKEKILHNLIFPQHSNNVTTSDMWIINEEFMYYAGCSEFKLLDILVNGEKLFDTDNLPNEVVEKLKAGSQDRLAKRPDIFLYPQEGKCVLVEFKAPDVDVSKHLNQITTYATYLRSYTQEKFNIINFYGYLIGENMQDLDIRAADGDFLQAPQLDFWYRTDKTIPCLFNQRKDSRDGHLYTEVIKYSTLLDRSRIRNKLFIQKLHSLNQASKKKHK